MATAMAEPDPALPPGQSIQAEAQSAGAAGLRAGGTGEFLGKVPAMRFLASKITGEAR